MAYDDKPHAAAFGTRYPDDSGWERLVEVDHSTGALTIKLNGSTLVADPAEMEWLEDALRIVRYATKPLTK